MPTLRSLRTFLVLACTLAALAAPALHAATTVLRGPYLQSPTSTSMVVRWRTDNTEASIVRFGLARTELTSTVKAEGIKTEHIVYLGNLKPNTRYYYSLGAAPAPAAATRKAATASASPVTRKWW